MLKILAVIGWILLVLVVLVLVLIVVLVLHNEHSFFIIWELRTHYVPFYSDVCGCFPFDCHSR